MLHHEALRQLTHELQQERLREAATERLARQARGSRRRHRRRLALDAVLELLRYGRRTAQSHGS